MSKAEIGLQTTRTDLKGRRVYKLNSQSCVGSIPFEPCHSL